MWELKVSFSLHVQIQYHINKVLLISHRLQDNILILFEFYYIFILFVTTCTWDFNLILICNYKTVWYFMYLVMLLELISCIFPLINNTYVIRKYAISQTNCDVFHFEVIDFWETQFRERFLLDHHWDRYFRPHTWHC